MNAKPLVLIPIALLAGCTQSSGVLKMGPDTYSVSVHAAPARGGEPGAMRLAMTEANQTCLSQGREILVNNVTSGRSSHFPGGTVDLIFQCLDRADSTLQRPSYSPRPDAVIQFW